jgi:hypothetical protein
VILPTTLQLIKDLLDVTGQVEPIMEAEHWLFISGCRKVRTLWYMMKYLQLFLASSPWFFSVNLHTHHKHPIVIYCTTVSRRLKSPWFIQQHKENRSLLNLGFRV